MTPRQQLFVERYLIHLNAGKAAEEAGCNACSARTQGSRLLRTPEVADAVHAALEKRAQRHQVTQERVLTELARIAFADLGNLAEWGPDEVKLKPVGEVPFDDRLAIAELTQGTGPGGKATRIKMHDKQRALETLARHLGMIGNRPLKEVPESPAIAAERVRELLRARMARLAAPEPEEAEAEAEAEDREAEGREPEDRQE